MPQAVRVLTVNTSQDAHAAGRTCVDWFSADRKQTDCNSFDHSQAHGVESQILNDLCWRLGPFFKEDKLPDLSPWSSLGHMDSLAGLWHQRDM